MHACDLQAINPYCSILRNVRSRTRTDILAERHSESNQISDSAKHCLCQSRQCSLHIMTGKTCNLPGDCGNTVDTCLLHVIETNIFSRDIGVSDHYLVQFHLLVKTTIRVAKMIIYSEFDSSVQ